MKVKLSLTTTEAEGLTLILTEFMDHFEDSNAWKIEYTLAKKLRSDLHSVSSNIPLNQEKRK